MLSECVQDPTAIFMVMNDIQLPYLRGKKMEDLILSVIAELNNLTEDQIRETLNEFKKLHNL